MMDRRTLLLGAGAMLVAPGAARTFQLDPKYEPKRVYYRRYPAGTIVVDTGNHFLFLVDDPPFALRYGVGVGRAGLSLKGKAIVERKAEWPWWRPTDNMIRRSPKKYARYAGGMPGGPNNPLGARALYLYRDGKDTMYRIHGTNEPSSIGQSVSNGCIRMVNDHVIELYDRVPVGTEVVVL
ncbi:L,D-transpeptidase [Bauldia sp.]|uniref:L,D-transpeptidase n=1 Tax=Bauldia sp. TaxID=2575872 RepID=UPI003BA9A61E